MISAYIKISFRIVITYIFYEFAEGFFIIRVFPVFNPLADQIAKNSPEIFMAGIGKK